MLCWLDPPACFLHGKVSSWQVPVVLELLVLEKSLHMHLRPLGTTVALLASPACSGAVTGLQRIELSDESVEAGTL